MGKKPLFNIRMNPALVEFRRVRNYYRRNFCDGQSDYSFLQWCKDMCEFNASLNRRKHEIRNNH